MILAIGEIDYITGLDIRVFPLYFIPIWIASWAMRRIGAIFSTILATITWGLSNNLATNSWSNEVWAINIFVQAIAFAVIACLVVITREKLINETKLRRIDGLTGLLNRIGFYEAVEPLINFANRYNQPVSIAYIDLDNFKKLNDTQGHATGDEALIQFALILKSTLRNSDIFCRMGGDEFIVLLPNTSSEEAYIALEKLRIQVQATLVGGVTASIGVISFKNNIKNIDELVIAADKAMYRIKSSSKNKVIVNTQTL